MTLASVAKQDMPAELWECVVVNNNSSDNTQALATQFAKEHPSLSISVVEERCQGLSYARNRGIESSVGEIVAIIDDDEIINEGFASAYVSLFESHPTALSAGGVIIPKYATKRPSWMSHYTELPIANPLYLGSEPRRFPKGQIPGGGNMAIRRSALDKYGLFDVELGRKGSQLIGGEESDLFERLSADGAECWYSPDAVMWHIIPPEKLTLDYFDRLTYNIGVSQRLRAEIVGRSIILAEMAKWVATLIIAVGYFVTLRPLKARYLCRMRRNISRGILRK